MTQAKENLIAVAVGTLGKDHEKINLLINKIETMPDDPDVIEGLKGLILLTISKESEAHTNDQKKKR